MRQLSEHVLAVGHRNQLTVTNLQLQKVMYFAVQDYIRDHGTDHFITDVYDNAFQTWQYGPVAPLAYRHFSTYGSTEILDKGEYHENYQTFDVSIIQHLQENVFDLVERSHEENFWIENQTNGIHRRENYTLNEIEAGI